VSRWVRSRAISVVVVVERAEIAVSADEHLAGFLGQLAPGHVEEDPEHYPADDALVVAPAASGHPPDLAAVQNAEVDFVSTQDFPRRRESCPHPVEVLRMDACGQTLKGDRSTSHPPQRVRALVQGDLVGVDIPRPQRDARRIGGDP
jgi:hypothetical protein